MFITREDAEEVLSRVHSVLASQELPPLRDFGLCNLLCYWDSCGPCAAYIVLALVYNHEIPYYRSEDCPPEWQGGVWSEERQTALCLLGALSVEDIMEMCNG